MTNVATMTLSTPDDPVTSVPSRSLISTIDMSTRLGRAFIQGDDQDNTITGSAFQDSLYGGNGDDILYGQSGNDILVGGHGADILYGALGNDFLSGLVSIAEPQFESDVVTMAGGGGDDTYRVYTVRDKIVEGANLGVDTVESFISFSLTNENLENITLMYGDALKQHHINATGNSKNNVITGNSGNNVLNGMGGADRMLGGGGSDTYIIDELDVIIDSGRGSADVDTIVVSFSYVLVNMDIEVLELIGSKHIHGTGNSGNNKIIANAGYNILDGLAGIDTVSYETANAGVTVGLAVSGIQETGGSGLDILKSFESVMGSQFDDVLTGSVVDNVLSGLAGDDRLYSGDGNDTLDGGMGVDWMEGGLGDDLYVVDSSNDVIIESNFGGVDTVQSSLDNYVLNEVLENLKLYVAGGNINGVGNGFDNIMEGNDSINALDGKGANDVIYGGGGGDQLLGDQGNDMLYGGNDHDQLIGGVGADFLDGELGDDDLKGESGNDILYGGGGNDVLDGGIGLDLMVGGSGDDVYTRNNSGDMIEELASGGTDTVYSSIHYTLDAYIENAVLLGDKNLNLKGTIFSNTLTGNQGQNILDGGAGADHLQGGGGNDIYKMGRGYGIDTIIENDNTAANRDQLRFSQNVAADQLWFRQVGNNLEVSIIGTNDKVVVQDWYLGTAYRTEQLLSGEGKTLRDANVQNLVNAMAGMNPPPLGQTELSAAQHSQLDGVIAANWV
mgnify:FL=1